jgi:hypothetical protein
VSLGLEPNQGLSEDDRADLLRALRSALSRGGIQVAEPGAPGVPALLGQMLRYDRGLERHRSPYGFLNFEHGELRAFWRLADASGVTIGECTTAHETSILRAHVWGDVLQSTGDDLVRFLGAPTR